MEAKVFERTNYSEEEYFEFFDQFERKIEYHDGRIEMMAGARAPHNDIVMNMILSLGKNSKKCKPHSSDQAVSIPDFKRYLYPDLSFSCGGPKFTSDKLTFLANPSLIVEVISGSSFDRDEVSKFRWYFSLPSVKEYILVNSLKMEVKSYLRKDESTWIMQSYWEEDQVLSIETLGEKISLKEIYNEVIIASEH